MPTAPRPAGAGRNVSIAIVPCALVALVGLSCTRRAPPPAALVAPPAARPVPPAAAVPPPAAPAGASAPAPTPASAVPPTPVDAAVFKAVGRLYATQTLDNWEAVPAPQPGGTGIRGEQWGLLTALSTWALLAAGEDPTNPKLAAALRWLESAPLTTPSVVAARAEVWALARDALPPGRLARLVAADDALLRASVLQGPAAGSSAGLYPPEAAGAAGSAGPPPYDLEASQAATLAELALDRAGAAAPAAYWLLVVNGWERAQQADGTWSPGAAGPAAARARMTASGAAAMAAARDRLDRADGFYLDCTRPAPGASQWGAVAAVDARAADAIGDPASLWAVERLALATGRKRFGATDWYAAGSAGLLASQNADGSWPAVAGADPAARRIPETAYAMLFLAYGRGPVVLAKLDYLTGRGPTSRNGPGFNRPHDAAHFVEWAGRQLHRPVSWQRVTPDASEEDLGDARVLLITGTASLEFTGPQLDGLRAFVLRGGLILGNADCNRQEFQRAFVALAKKLFPAYEFNDLPRAQAPATGHMFWRDQWRISRVSGLSNGVRELMILVSVGDPSRALQADSAAANAGPFEFGLDVLRYVRNPQDWPGRGASNTVVRNPGVVARATTRVARLLYHGNDDPEPAGWQRLADLMHNQFQTDLDVVPVEPGKGRLTGGDKPFRVAHLTGTTRFSLTPAARAEIAEFVNGGGTLIVDAAGGSEAFAASAVGELTAMFPQAPDPSSGTVGQVLGPLSALYTLAGAKIDLFQYRRFALGRMAGIPGSPHVRGITIANRIAVFFSPEDLSAGLAGAETDGIVGYAPDTATALMRNMLLYAARP